MKWIGNCTSRGINQNTNDDATQTTPTHFGDFDDEGNGDFDQLNTPSKSDDEEGIEKFPLFKPGDGVRFQIGLRFNNKKMTREAIKEYAMFE